MDLELCVDILADVACRLRSWEVRTWSAGSLGAMCETGHVRSLQVCTRETREFISISDKLCATAYVTPQKVLVSTELIGK